MKRSAPVAALSAALLLLAPAASAHGNRGPDVIAEGLVAPLSFDIEHGNAYVAQSFAGLVTKIDRQGNRTDIVTAPGAQTGAVSVGHHKLTYSTLIVNEDFTEGRAEIRQIDKRGKDRLLVDLWEWEETNNVDADVQYGFIDLDEAEDPAQCAADIEAVLGFPAVAGGDVNSNPYASVTLKSGAYVADAGANAILHVNHRGDVRVVAILRGVDTVVSEEQAATLGMPDCVVGRTYRAQPVPTDVEIGHNGWLYVTLLPGGPEGPELGARGQIVRVHPWYGTVKHVAQGFLGATNLAIGDKGEIYVTELFGNRVSVVSHGKVRTFAELPGAAAVEYDHGRVYVTTADFETGLGDLVVLKDGKYRH